MKNFKKKDLKTGMIVEFRNGTLLIVLLNSESGDILTGIRGECSDHDGIGILNFEDNLMSSPSGVSQLDIIRVYSQKEDYSLSADKTGKLLWERSTEKPVHTYKGIEYSESTLNSILDKFTK